MEWVVTTGRTVDEAKDAALDQLGVDMDEAEFEVLEEPKTGLFGRMRSEAQVRARVAPTSPRPKVERGQRRKPRGNGTGDGPGGQASAGQGSAGQAKRSGGKGPRSTTSDGASDSAPARNAENAGESANGGGSGNSRGPRGGGRPNKTSQKRTIPEEITNMAEQQTVIEDFVKGLVDAFDLEAKIDTRSSDDEITINLEGDDLGLLIGPRGATLQSIQDLSRAVLQRHFPDDRHARIRIDVGGYRERRRQALERFVHSVAEEVLSSGRQKALEPMTSPDRKVVHDTANDIEGVHTISEGYEPTRRVVILPDGA